MKSKIALMLLILFLPSCLSRQLHINTDPPGATVFVNRREVGKTPLSVDFLYGGDREFIILHEEGEQPYKVLKVVQKVDHFFYDTFPFDIMTDLMPFEHGDEFHFNFKLEPSTLGEEAANNPDHIAFLIERAQQMRKRARDAQLYGDPDKPAYLPESPPSPTESGTGSEPQAEPNPKTKSAEPEASESEGKK